MIFSIIYQSGSVEAAIMSENPLFRIMRVIMIIIGGYFLITVFKYKTEFMKLGLLILVSICLICINYLLYPDSLYPLSYKVILFIIFYFMVASANKSQININDIIYNIIFCIASITLILYVGIELLHINIPYNIIRNSDMGSYAYKNYFNIFYSYHSGSIPRLSGMFWEPGVYVIYLNYALFEMLYKDKIKKIHLVVLLLNILFAQSTMGYCIAALMIAVILGKSNKNSKKSRKILLFVLVLCGLCASILFVLIKKKTTNFEGGSYYLRKQDFINCYNLFKENWLFGTGFYNTVSFGQGDDIIRGSSNGFLTWCYTTGLVGIMIAIFPFIKNIYKSENNKRQLLYLGIVLLFNNAEPIYNLPFMVFVVAQEYYKTSLKAK